MHQAVLASLIAGVAVLVSACGSSGAKPSPTVAPTATLVNDQEFQGAAAKVADATILVAGDFPAGWTGTPHNGWTGTPHNKTDMLPFTGECTPLNPDDPISGSVVSKSSDDFTDLDTGDDAMSHVDIFRTAALASDSLQNLVDIVGRCHDQFVSVFTQVFQQSVSAFTQLFQQLAPGSDTSASAQNVQITFGELSVPALGDTTYGYRLGFSFTIKGMQTSGETDLVFIQRGRLIGEVILSAIDGKMALRDTLAPIFADRLTEADRQLPQ